MLRSLESIRLKHKTFMVIFSPLLKQLLYCKLSIIAESWQACLNLKYTGNFRAPEKRDIEDNSKTIFLISQ